jgi:hypothetical protein
MEIKEILDGLVFRVDKGEETKHRQGPQYLVARINPAMDVLADELIIDPNHERFFSNRILGGAGSAIVDAEGDVRAASREAFLRSRHPLFSNAVRVVCRS